MNNLIVKNFHDKEIHTFFWNNRLCWIAGEVVGAMEYADEAKTIAQCIDTEDFKNGVEFEVLRGEALKAFKQMLSKGTTVEVVPSVKVETAKHSLANLIKYASQLTIFYEPGLYGFVEYSQKPIGREFRTWLRRDVLPEIRETGAYISDKADPSLLREKADKLEKLGTVNNAAKILLPVLTDAGVRPEIRALTMQQLYRKAGFELNKEREGFCLGFFAAMDLWREYAAERGEEETP